MAEFNYKHIPQEVRDRPEFKAIAGDHPFASWLKGVLRTAWLYFIGGLFLVPLANVIIKGCFWFKDGVWYEFVLQDLLINNYIFFPKETLYSVTFLGWNKVINYIFSCEVWVIVFAFSLFLVFIEIVIVDRR